jgi:hypothetical protein
MSMYDYQLSIEISAVDYPFYALIMAAMRQADSENALNLRMAFPGVAYELQARYNAPGGVIPGDTVERAAPLDGRSAPDFPPDHCPTCGAEHDPDGRPTW